MRAPKPALIAEAALRLVNEVALSGGLTKLRDELSALGGTERIVSEVEEIPRLQDLPRWQMLGPSGPEQKLSYLNCAIPQTHWHRSEALTQVGALDERFLGYAMIPSGVNRA